MHKTTMTGSIAVLALAVTTALVLTGPAAKAEGNAEWYVAPALNYVIADDDRDADDDLGFQIGIGKYLSEAWNFEVNFEADTLDINDGGEFKQRGLSINSLYFFGRSPGFSPYGLFGAGALRTKAPGEKGTNPMANAGIGFLSNVISDAVALRAEARYRWDGDDDSIASEDSFSDWIVSLGLSIPLGSAAAPAAVAAPMAVAPPAPKDSDGDGVNDDKDACPDTPAGARVDARGCELDSDGDGVPDSMDRCPGTPAGVRVDAQGCEPDSDGDGVPDSKDRCPGTPAGVRVDAQGCEPDSDGDGVPDSADRCPGTPAGVRVDAQGCEPDSDGDGVPDSKDRCPDTVAGAKVDVRGCEIKEVIELPGVNFETGSARLVAESVAILDEAAETLIKHPDIRAEVAGHTDNTGPRAFNLDLSQRRAETVLNYLVSKGVPAGNLAARGYGPDRPVADNVTKDGRAANRRVELQIAK